MRRCFSPCLPKEAADVSEECMESDSFRIASRAESPFHCLYTTSRASVGACSRRTSWSSPGELEDVLGLGSSISISTAEAEPRLGISQYIATDGHVLAAGLDAGEASCLTVRSMDISADADEQPRSRVNDSYGSKVSNFQALDRGLES